MSISENTIAAAKRAIDHANEMPEITPAMIAAGAEILKARLPNDIDPLRVEAVSALIFEAMWLARIPKRVAA